MSFGFEGEVDAVNTREAWTGRFITKHGKTVMAYKKWRHVPYFPFVDSGGVDLNSNLNI